MNEELINATIEMNLQRILLSEEKPIPDGSMLCDFINIIFLKLQNCRNREQVSDSHQFKRKGGDRKILCLDFIDANILCCCTVVLQDFTFGDN